MKFLLLALILITGGILMAENPRVVLQTNLGDIVLELLPEKAPITVDNFLQYVEEGFYDNTVFHRVIKGFMIQGGGFDASGNRKEPRAPIKNEADNGLQNNLGTIAMARTPQKDSATSQFFINVTNNTFLNHGKRNFGYCVFGHLLSGLDVVRKIENTPTTIEKGMKDWPQEDIIIQKAYLVLNEETLPEK